MANKTVHIKKQLLDALVESKGIVTTACKSIGISRTTYYDYYKNDKEFKTTVDELQNVALDFAEEKLHELINEKNPSAIMFYLKCKGQHRGYIEKQYFDHTTKGESLNQINVTADNNNSKKELEALIGFAAQNN